MSDVQGSRITTFLWYNTNAEEAVAFYLGVFPNSRRTDELLAPIEGQGLAIPKGKPLTISFELDGRRFTAMNGGPGVAFNEAISLVVNCKDQAEIDFYWAALTADGGSEIQCGWLKDKYGLRWQVVPVNIGALVSPPKAMQAMMKMKKLVIAELERAGKE
jgi:predicted 3-demethylubiquinone-9 3-methyltransferase (glyoxalase superfamily)